MSTIVKCLMLLLAIVPASETRLAAAVPIVRSSAALHIRVIGLRNSHGQVVCTLFDSPAAFPSDSSKAIAQTVAAVKNRGAQIEFRGLRPGRYAFVLFHDEDSNGKFERNWLGMPLEGYAFSNNFRPVFAAPSFDQAAFYYSGADLQLTIAMRY